MLGPLVQVLLVPHARIDQILTYLKTSKITLDNEHNMIEISETVTIGTRGFLLWGDTTVDFMYQSSSMCISDNNCDREHLEFRVAMQIFLVVSSPPTDPRMCLCVDQLV